MESAHTMMAQAGLPEQYWAVAVATAAYLRNQTPTRSLKGKTTPYEKWYGNKPVLSHLRVFGCVAYAYIPDANRKGKLSKKAEKLHFIGYSLQTKGYRLIDQKNLKVVIHRNVIFNESDFLCDSEVNDGVTVNSHEKGMVHEEDQESVEQPEQDNQSDDQHQYPSRQRTVPIWCGIDEYVDTAFLGENETWELVELPNGWKPVGCKWVFKTRCGSDGKVECHKAQLVAKGYTQKHRVDYDETFSPVVRYSSIQALLAFA